MLDLWIFKKYIGSKKTSKDCIKSLNIVVKDTFGEFLQFCKKKLKKEYFVAKSFFWGGGNHHNYLQHERRL
jgi:hypothetical protein